MNTRSSKSTKATTEAEAKGNTVESVVKVSKDMVIIDITDTTDDDSDACTNSPHSEIGEKPVVQVKVSTK